MQKVAGDGREGMDVAIRGRQCTQRVGALRRRLRLLIPDSLGDSILASGGTRCTLRLVLSVLGLSLWWPLIRNSVTGFVFAAAAAEGAPWGQRDALCLFVVVVVLGAVAVALAGVRCRTIPAGAFLALGIVSSVANAVAVWLPSTGSLVASAVLLGLVFVGFSAAWGWWLAEQAADGREILLVGAASYALSFVVGYLSYAPVPWSWVRPLGAPLITGVCWYACVRMSGADIRPLVRSSRETGSLERNLYVLVLVFFLVGSVATGFINTGSVAYVPSGGTLIRDTLSLGITLGLMVLAAVTRRFERAVFLLVSVLGAVQFAGIFIATFFGEGWVSYGAGLMQASKSWFSVMLFVLVLSGRRAEMSLVRHIALLFVLPVTASVGISYLAVPALATSFSIDYEGFWGTLSVTMGFFLGVLVFVFLSSMVVRNLPAEESHVHDGAATVEDVARSLGEKCGCTARERDVLALLVAGNTYKKVAELLGVSENTVQYHSKNIYRKLGVHTKQELVDLVARGR